jgi:glutamate transport system permease protein
MLEGVRVEVLVDRFDVFASGLWVTVQVCLLAAIGALVLGTVAAVLRISPVPPLRAVGTGYVTVFRNMPLTVVSVFVAFGLPQLGSDASFLKIPVLDRAFPRLAIDLPYFRFFVIALSLYTGAFVCEALRAGINAVPAGQAEAARSLGLTFGQNLRHVVLPQAWKYAVVPLGSVIIAMIKNSAIGSLVGVSGSLSATMDVLTSQEGLPLIPVFVGISAGYLLLTIPLGILLDRIELRRAVAR